MTLMVICCGFYLFLTAKFSEKLFFWKKILLEKVYFSVCGCLFQIDIQSGELVLKLYTNKPYGLLVQVEITKY